LNRSYNNFKVSPWRDVALLACCPCWVTLRRGVLQTRQRRQTTDTSETY